MKVRHLIYVLLLSSAMILGGCQDKPTDDQDAKAKRLAKQKEQRQHSIYEFEKYIKPGQKPYGAIASIDLNQTEAKLSYKQDLTLSPDGKWAVLTAQTGGETDQLILVNLPERKSTTIASGKNIKFHGWSKDSQNLIYSSQGLYLSSLKTGKKRKISNTATVAGLSDDGSKIAYIEPEAGLLVCSTKGGSPKLVAKGVLNNQILWYPDNNRVMFWQGDEQNSVAKLSRVYNDGSGEKTLIAKLTGAPEQTYWLVPGQKAVSVIQTPKEETYWLLDLVQGQELQLGEVKMDINRETTVAIDSTKSEILIAGSGLIYFYNANGQLIQRSQMDDGTFDNYDYTYATDGKKVAFLYGSARKAKINDIKGRRLWVWDRVQSTNATITPSYGSYYDPQWLNAKEVVLVEDVTKDQKQHCILWIVNIGE